LKPLSLRRWLFLFSYIRLISDSEKKQSAKYPDILCFVYLSATNPTNKLCFGPNDRLFGF
ncbi:MAG: hypothetical protein KKB74_01140, partial [Bacteroidetes bacterium]|nr:hypothetical protein [Bacteroidota bacterium]